VVVGGDRPHAEKMFRFLPAEKTQIRTDNTFFLTSITLIHKNPRSGAVQDEVYIL
jgi:hypothetical protein